MHVLKKIVICTEENAEYKTRTYNLPKKVYTTSTNDFTDIVNNVMVFKLMIDKSLNTQFVIPNVVSFHERSIKFVYDVYNIDSFDKDLRRYGECVAQRTEEYLLEVNKESVVEKYIENNRSVELRHLIDDYDTTYLTNINNLKDSILIAGVYKKPLLLAVLDTIELIDIAANSKLNINLDLEYTEYLNKVLPLDNSLIYCRIFNEKDTRKLENKIRDYVIKNTKRFGKISNDDGYVGICRYIDITGSKVIFIEKETL